MKENKQVKIENKDTELFKSKLKDLISNNFIAAGRDEPIWFNHLAIVQALAECLLGTKTYNEVRNRWGGIDVKIGKENKFFLDLEQLLKDAKGMNVDLLKDLICSAIDESFEEIDLNTYNKYLKDEYASEKFHFVTKDKDTHTKEGMKKWVIDQVQTTETYDKSNSVQSNNNLKPNTEIEDFTLSEKNSEKEKIKCISNYLLKPNENTNCNDFCNGLRAIKDFSKNHPKSNSANAMNELFNNILKILNNDLYQDKDEMILALKTVCLDAKSSIKGFTLFSRGVHVINNFMDKSIENAKNHVKQSGDLEDSLEEKNWVIIKN